MPIAPSLLQHLIHSLLQGALSYASTYPFHTIGLFGEYIFPGRNDRNGLTRFRGSIDRTRCSQPKLPCMPRRSTREIESPTQYRSRACQQLSQERAGPRSTREPEQTQRTWGKRRRRRSRSQCQCQCHQAGTASSMS